MRRNQGFRTCWAYLRLAPFLVFSFVVFICLYRISTLIQSSPTSTGYYAYPALTPCIYPGYDTTDLRLLRPYHGFYAIRLLRRPHAFYAIPRLLRHCIQASTPFYLGFYANYLASTLPNRLLRHSRLSRHFPCSDALQLSFRADLRSLTSGSFPVD